MTDQELIKKMHAFAIELGLKVSRKDFDEIREKWNLLMSECEKRM